MAPNGSGGTRNSSTTIKSKNALKKGPWTSSEDMLLIEYVQKHGEGNWNSVQRNSGLMRCGKSCRLRWANHLRPNLKKGSFSADEEKLIVELHSKLGNKWARMASQLPGRTDNEIKNYWNTRLKRCQRSGLPIYPQEVHKDQFQLNYSSSPTSLSSFLASTQPPNPNPPCLFDPFNPSTRMDPQQNQLNPSYLHELKFFNENNGNNNLALSLAASNSSFSSSNLHINPFYNPGLSNPLPISSMIQYGSHNFGIHNSSSSVGVLGLPSIQSPLMVTPTASSSEFMMATSSDEVEDYEVEPTGFAKRNKSGLLEDLLGESLGLTVGERSAGSFNATLGNSHGKTTLGFGNAISENNYEGKEHKATTRAINGVDEDLLNLLDNFPLSVPIPDWNEANDNESPDLTNGTNRALETQPNNSQFNPFATSSMIGNQDWSFGSTSWNIMPNIS
ncbi:hypothetical protein ACJIZ3_010864 [Penstemon smallii]|uniref:Uncharacterized protein n=1 Tax=Penstemon smallii TaxID=265156 RepID=A0ABD3UIX0_9LAMI